MPPVLSKLPVMISDEDIIDKRYENCVIYKLVHKDDEDAYEKYVGHTIMGLNKRYYFHKSNYYNVKSNNYNVKLYQYIREKSCIDDWKIILLEEFPCNNKRDAEKRETFWYNEIKPILNTTIPSRSKMEYYYDNKEKIRKKVKEYRKNNPELIKEREKVYREVHTEAKSKKEKRNITCENCGSIVRIYKLNRHLLTDKCINHINTPF